MNNKIKKIGKHPYFKYGLILLAGLFLGWLIFSGNNGKQSSLQTSTVEEAHNHDHGDDPAVWTCSMHPQIRMDEPGLCPICAMDLIPLQSTGSGDATIDPDAIQMSTEAIALANIQTTVVNR